MKTQTFFLSLLLLCPFMLAKGAITNFSVEEPKDTSANYHDGAYYGSSKGKYKGESYWGHINLKVDKGAFTEVDFCIRDSSAHEIVDSIYGVKHFSYSKLYMEQCINEEHGIELYKQKLLEKQNLEEVDAITGATWSHNIFIASANEALKDAKIATGMIAPESKGINLKITPNPFSTDVAIEYCLATTGDVNLCFYDAQGKMIKEIINHPQYAGNYRIVWDNCPASGIYFYRIKHKGGEISGKIIKTN